MPSQKTLDRFEEEREDKMLDGCHTCGAVKVSQCARLKDPYDPDCAAHRHLKLHPPKLLDNNPKTAEGAKKRQLQLVPLSILEALAGPFTLGAKKYGPFNYLVVPVHASTYIGAALRHIAAYQNGKAVDPETGECPIHSALASLGVIVAARAAGTLLDDGAATAVYSEWLAVQQKKEEGNN
jgi:hypothetical protein